MGLKTINGMSDKNRDCYFTEKTILIIYAKYGYCCYVCKSQKKLDIHHIIPRKEGGTNDLTNLVLLCRKCHGAIETGDIAHAVQKCVGNAINNVKARF